MNNSSPALMEVTFWWRDIRNKEVGKYVNKIISQERLQRKQKIIRVMKGVEVVDEYSGGRWKII